MDDETRERFDRIDRQLDRRPPWSVEQWAGGPPLEREPAGDTVGRGVEFDRGIEAIDK